MAVFNQTPGDGQTASADSVQTMVLIELRIISLILAQMNPGLVQPDDLDNLRSDPSLLHQRLS